MCHTPSQRYLLTNVILSALGNSSTGLVFEGTMESSKGRVSKTVPTSLDVQEKLLTRPIGLQGRPARLQNITAPLPLQFTTCVTTREGAEVVDSGL